MANKYHEIMQKAVSSATNLTIVAPGNNIAKLANESNVFENSRIELINHGIDFGIFRKEEKQTARNILNLPPDKKIILTVCDDYNRLNKNFQILFDKLGNTLAEDKVILAVGNNFNNLSIPDTAKFIDFGFVMNDLLMKLLYSAADVTIVPSKFETFSLVTLESIACGTPVTAFDNSGPSEIIHHKQNGYLAKFEDFDELISGTDYCLNYLNNNANIRADEKYDLDMVSGNYIKLYDSLNA